MIETRCKGKGLKKMCVYIWQQERDGKVDTFIDHIGDEELYNELKKSILREELEKILYKN